MNNSFNEPDYLEAKEAFARWQSSVNESIDEYMLRRRKAELNELVKKVINNELSDYDKIIVQLRWYENLTPTEIAKKLGIDRSTVSRHLEKINSTIYEKLKYAIEYRYGKNFSEQSRLIIKSGEAYFSTVKPNEISGRMKNLRNGQFLTVADVSEMTGIKKHRIEEIEENGSKMTMPELKKLSIFYRCTCDYILFGN